MDGPSRDPATVRRVLAERARALAEPHTADARAERIELLGFELASESFAVESCHVREVRGLRSLTSLPCTPPFIAGITPHHGRILAIIDLRRVFSLPDVGLTELNRVVVLGDGSDELGLLADSVSGVSAPSATLDTELPTLRGIHRRFFLGVTSDLVAVLDGARLLDDPALKVHANRPHTGPRR